MCKNRIKVLRKNMFERHENFGFTKSNLKLPGTNLRTYSVKYHDYQPI